MEYENNVIYSYDRFLVHLQNHMRQFLTKIHISYGDIVRDTEMGMLKGTTRLSKNSNSQFLGSRILHIQSDKHKMSAFSLSLF